MLILILSITGVKSQSYLPNGFEYLLEFINIGQAENGTDTIYTVKVVLDNNGIADLAAINVKVWKTQTIDAEILIEHSFINNVSASTPEGTSLEISGGKTIISLGDHVSKEFAYEVILVNTQGQISLPGGMSFEGNE